MKLIVWTVTAAISANAALPHEVLAAGIRTANHNARAIGQSEAVVASVDDASAVYYNPAALTLSSGLQFEAGAWWWQPSIRYGGAGASEEMNTGQLIPSFFASTDAGTKRWRFGFGVNNVFGTTVDWGEASSFRLIVTKARLNVLNFAPAVAYQVSDVFAIGMNVNVYHSDADLQNNVILAAPPLPEGRFRFQGDGLGVGATLGLVWKPAPRHALGLVYRSPFGINVSGDATLQTPVPPGVSAGTSARIDFPQIISAGYAFHPTDFLKLEADVEWTDWNVANEVKFTSSNPGFDAIAIPLNWHSSFTYRAGMDWRVSESWSIQAGYAFWENSVPNSTFSPLLPDSDFHSFTGGLTYQQKRWRTSVAYQFNLWEDRVVSGSVYSPAVDGKWAAQSHVMALTVGMRF